MDNNQFKTELHNIAVSTVGNHGYRFSNDADRQLVDIIEVGISTMNSSGRTTDADMDLARRNMRKLCRELVLRESSSVIVENRTFSAARFSICPLWPFC